MNIVNNNLLVKEILKTKDSQQNQIFYYNLKDCNLPAFIIEQYEALLDMYKNEEYYGALYQAKDLLELLIKFPQILLLNRICNFIINENQDNDLLETKDLKRIKSILEKILGKPLSFGDWETMVADYCELENSKIFEEESGAIYKGIFKQISANKAALNNFKINGTKVRVSAWRNKKLGHGAINTNKYDIIPDVEGIIIAINDFLSNTSMVKNSLCFYEGIGFAFGEAAVLSGSEDNRLDGKNEYPLILVDNSSTGHLEYLTPFVFRIQNNNDRMDERYHVLFMEGYDGRKNKAGVIDYDNGDLFLEARLFNVLKNVEKRLKLDNLQNDELAEEEVSLEVHNKLIELVNVQKSNYMDNIYLSQLVKENLNADNRLLWLQAERGMGKTIFAVNADFGRMLVFRYLINGFYNSLTKAFCKQFCDFINSINQTVTEKKEFVNARIAFEDKFNNDATVEERKLAFANFLRLVGEKLGNESLLLVIDGLDEMPINSDKDMLSLAFFADNKILPDNVYMLLLSRTVQEFPLADGSLLKDTKTVAANRFSATYDKLVRKYISKSLDRNFVNVRIDNAKQKSELLNKKQELTNLIIKKSDFRFIYVNALVKIFELFKNKYRILEYNDAMTCTIDFLRFLNNFKGYAVVTASNESLNNTSEFLSLFLGEIEQYSKKYAKQVLKALIILALVNDKITIAEFSYLLSRDTRILLQHIEIIVDIISFIRIERSNEGSLLCLSNEAWIEAILQYDKELVKEIKETMFVWAKNIVDTVVNASKGARMFCEDVFDRQQTDIMFTNYKLYKDYDFGKICISSNALLVEKFYLDSIKDSSNEAKNIAEFCYRYSPYKLSSTRILTRLYSILGRFNEYKAVEEVLETVETKLFSLSEHKMSNTWTELESFISVKGLCEYAEKEIKERNSLKGIEILEIAEEKCLEEISKYKDDIYDGVGDSSFYYFRSQGPLLQTLVRYINVSDLKCDAYEQLGKFPEILEQLKKKFYALKQKKGYCERSIEKIEERIIEKKVELLDLEVYQVLDELTFSFCSAAIDMGQCYLDMCSFQSAHFGEEFSDFNNPKMIQEVLAEIDCSSYYDSQDRRFGTNVLYIRVERLTNSVIKMQLLLMLADWYFKNNQKEEYSSAFIQARKVYDFVRSLQFYTLQVDQECKLSLIENCNDEDEKYRNERKKNQEEDKRNTLELTEKFVKLYDYLLNKHLDVQGENYSYEELIKIYTERAYLPRYDKNWEVYVDCSDIAVTLKVILPLLITHDELKIDKELREDIELITGYFNEKFGEKHQTFCIDSEPVDVVYLKLLVDYYLLECNEVINGDDSLSLMSYIIEVVNYLHDKVDDVEALDKIYVRTLSRKACLMCYLKKDSSQIKESLEELYNIRALAKEKNDLLRLVSAYYYAINIYFKGILGIFARIKWKNKYIKIIIGCTFYENVDPFEVGKTVKAEVAKIMKEQWYLKGDYYVEGD